MSPEAGRQWFRLGFFISIISLILLPFQPRDSAEFVITVLSLIIGLIMLGLVAIIIKISKR